MLSSIASLYESPPSAVAFPRRWTSPKYMECLVIGRTTPIGRTNQPIGTMRGLKQLHVHHPHNLQFNRSNSSMHV